MNIDEGVIIFKAVAKAARDIAYDQYDPTPPAECNGNFFSRWQYQRHYKRYYSNNNASWKAARREKAELWKRRWEAVKSVGGSLIGLGLIIGILLSGIIGGIMEVIRSKRASREKTFVYPSRTTDKPPWMIQKSSFPKDFRLPNSTQKAC